MRAEKRTRRARNRADGVGRTIQNGTYGEGVPIQLGPLWRGLDSTTRCERTAFLEPMAERDEHRARIRCCPGIVFGFWKYQPTFGSDRPDGKAGGKTSANESHPSRDSTSHRKSYFPALIRLRSNIVQSSSSSPQQCSASSAHGDTGERWQ